MMPNRGKRRFGILSSSSLNIRSNHTKSSTSGRHHSSSSDTTTSKNHNSNSNSNNSNSNNNTVAIAIGSSSTSSHCEKQHTAQKEDNQEQTQPRRYGDNDDDKDKDVSLFKQLPLQRQSSNADKGSRMNDSAKGSSSYSSTNTNANGKHSTTPTKMTLGEIYKGCLQVWNEQTKGIAACISPRYGSSVGSHGSVSVSGSRSGSSNENDDDVSGSRRAESRSRSSKVVRDNSNGNGHGDDNGHGHGSGRSDYGSGMDHDHNNRKHVASTPNAIATTSNSAASNTTTTTASHPNAATITDNNSKTNHHPNYNPHNQHNHNLNHSNKNKHNNMNKMPGIFHLMDQNQWQRVQQRALKYPKECRVSAVLSSSKSQSQTVNQNDMNTHDTLLLLLQEQQMMPQKQYKCKALHYACHRLRRVHGYIRKCITESIPQSLEEEDDEEDQPWDDPWVEACKAILIILEQYPEAAKMRETKHGCLPIHLAVFAMCPTPMPREWGRKEEQNVGGVDVGSTFDKSIEKWESDWTSRKGGEVVNSHVNANANANDSETIVPPRPFGPRQRRLSNSSADDSGGSSVLGGQSQSLDGWSANMEKECERGSNELDMELEKLELQLRSRPDAKLSALDEANLLESARLLSSGSARDGYSVGGGGGGNSVGGDTSSIMGNGMTLKRGMLPLSKPSSLHSIMTMASSDGARSISMGSYTSSCSTSVMSVSSCSVHASNTTVCKHRRFNWSKYIANEETREEYSLKVLHALLDAYPKCVRVDSEGGRLPLHTAVAGKATLSIIETLAKAYPYACRHRNNENSLPLHLVACYGVSHPGVAPMLLRLYPYACVGRNRWERTPLEEALLKGGENGRDHQEALCWVLRKPPEYWAGGYFGDNMMYDELRKRFVTKEVVGRHGVDVDNCRQEEIASDDTLLNHDDLFSLIRKRQWDTIVTNIDRLKEQANKLTKCEVRGGQIAMVSALYFTCELDPSYEVLDALVNVCPGATTWRKQPGGQLPIHALCTWGGSREAIGFLLAACPESAKRRDDNGNLALHAACYSGSSESVIQSLLLCDPKAVNVANVQGSFPRDIVCQLAHRNQKKVLHLIENVSLELLEKKRCHEKKKVIQSQINSQIDRVLEEQSNKTKEKSLMKRSFFRFSRKEKKGDSWLGGDGQQQQQQQAFCSPKMNITGSPSPEENIEVSLEEQESCEELLWV